jgi:phosphopantothenoylcysteine decarboxylase / phosphopantothenate---cysteine ligase
VILKNKKILLGVSGSIAAYKSAFLVRLLVKQGAEVQVVCTEAAKDFITPLTLATLSDKPVYSSFNATDTGVWTNHVALGLWADALIIAPATANTLAKCANGICNDLLTAVYLSAKCPVIFAPAMDLDMYAHGSTLQNIQKLESFGNQVLKAGHGQLASGLVGDGRMAEPEEIVVQLENLLGTIAEFTGKNILITSGPTQEALDPVRFISNHSSGKMGLALANRLAQAGANVTLVNGPSALPVNNPKINLVKVRSANDMYQACKIHFPTAHITIFAAAVADYTPSHVADKKIKKKEANFDIHLEKTVDIAATLGQEKKTGQSIVGFALETDNELANAQDKLERKNLDMIVLNSLQTAGAGFGHDTNQVTIIHKNGQPITFDLKTKTEVANDIVLELKKLL